MDSSNGLRLLLAARKSRKSDDVVQFERQEARNRERAERDGHTIIHTTRDVVSSQTMPWERRELKAWMTDPQKLAMYDGIIVETDRLARCDDRGWHYIEHWCYEREKVIVTSEGVRFPARDDSDRYQWIGLKRRARTYWEDVRDKQAGGRAIVRANGGAIGSIPFGYTITGVKYRKQFEPHPVNGLLAVEAFQRIADGRSASSVAAWLSEMTGKPWRVKRVIDMIRRRSYLGERDGHTYPLLAEGFRELWEQANNALDARSIKRGGQVVVHAYSSLIFCPCGATWFRHQSTKHGVPVGSERYRCSRGRRGIAKERGCGREALDFGRVNAAVDRAMRAVDYPEVVAVTTGGDFAKRQFLAELKDRMTAALAAGDMAQVTVLAAEHAVAEAQPSEPVRTYGKLTGRNLGQVWESENLAGRRAMLRSGQFVVIVTGDDDAVVEFPANDDEEAVLSQARRGWPHEVVQYLGATLSTDGA